MRINTRRQSIIICTRVSLKYIKIRQGGNRTTKNFCSNKDDDGSEQNKKTAFNTTHTHANDKGTATRKRKDHQGLNEPVRPIVGYPNGKGKPVRQSLDDRLPLFPTILILVNAIPEVIVAF